MAPERKVSEHKEIPYVSEEKGQRLYMKMFCKHAVLLEMQRVNCELNSNFSFLDNLCTESKSDFKFCLQTLCCS